MRNCTNVMLLHSSSNEYQSAQAILSRAFQGKFQRFVIPCVVASGDIKDRKASEPLSFRYGVLETGQGVTGRKLTAPSPLLVRSEV